MPFRDGDELFALEFIVPEFELLPEPEFDLMFEFIFEFVFEFMLPELLPVPLEFVFDIGVDDVVVEELFDIIVEFELEFPLRAFAFEFILPSAPPHPSIAAETVRHKPVKRSFLIIYLVLSKVIF